MSGQSISRPLLLRG